MADAMKDMLSLLSAASTSVHDVDDTHLLL
jgi:hypothetical protein